MNPEDEAEEDGANIDLDSQRKGKCVVLKTSTRQVSNLFSLISVFCIIFPVFSFRCVHRMCALPSLICVKVINL
jgi:hypothetical protein